MRSLPSMSVAGPMARNVTDLALLLSVQAGYDCPRAAVLGRRWRAYSAALESDLQGQADCLGRATFSGYAAVRTGRAGGVQEGAEDLRVDGLRRRGGAAGLSVDAVWRAFVTAARLAAGGSLLAYYNDPAKRALLKPEAIFEVESGLKLTAFDITAASAVRTEWYQAVRRFFERYDYFIVPTAQVFPFDVNLHWPQEIAGTRWRPITSG